MPVKFHPHNPIDSLEKIILKEDGQPLNGEIAIYRKLYNDLTRSDKDWEVWHDLKLPVHSDTFNYYKKTGAQIDFLIMCEEGIMVIEVKGGFVSSKENKFYHGKEFEEELPQNPFKQVEGYKHTLKDKVLNNVKGCFFCEAVTFPHVNYSFKTKIYDNNLLWTDYKAEKYDDSIEEFILEVFRYTKNKHNKHFRTYKKLSAIQQSAIRKILSPMIYDKNKFNVIDTLEWLGIDNIEILEGLYRNQRIMIEGPPGSGKTTIAKAYIDQQPGKKGIYICWNNFLMKYMESVLSTRFDYKSIEVTTYFNFFKSRNPDINTSEILEYTEGQFYDLVKSTIKYEQSNDRLKNYDYVVIDEAQDLFDRGLDLFINSYCGYGSSGLSNGNCLIIYDIDQSYSISGRPVRELADLVSDYFAHFKLDEVKRSAQNPDIRKLASDVLDDPRIIASPDFSSLFQEVRVKFHKSLIDVKKHIVHNILMPIRKPDCSLKGKDCIVLIESKFLRGSYKGSEDLGEILIIKDVEELSELNIGDKANKLRYSSILKFKGLEKKNVFLIIGDPSELNKYEIFVGITRAILNLEINIIKE